MLVPPTLTRGALDVVGGHRLQLSTLAALSPTERDELVALLTRVAGV